MINCFRNFIEIENKEIKNRTDCVRVLLFTHGRFCLCCFSSV